MDTNANGGLTNTKVPGVSAGTIAPDAMLDSSPDHLAVPRDVRLLHLILASLGITQYQDHVPLQLMDFAYRYSYGVLQDAVLYHDHAGSLGTNNLKTYPLTVEDIRLAVAARTNYQFKPAPPKALLLEVAAEKNKKALPAVMAGWGLRLPPEKYCLTSKDWTLAEQAEEEEEMKNVDADEMEMDLDV